MIFASKSGSPKRGVKRVRVEEVFDIDKRIILKRCAVKKVLCRAKKIISIFFLTDRAKDHDLANQ
jgi:hypothetical protein